GHRPRPPAAGEDRGRPGAAEARADRVGRRIPVPAVSGPLRSALLVLAAALAAGALIGVVYSWGDAALTVLLLLVLGAPAVVAAHVARARRRRLGSPRRQIALGIAIGLAELAVVVGAGVA